MLESSPHSPQTSDAARSPHWHIAWLLALAVLASPCATLAQSPAAPPQLDVATSRDWQRLVSVALDGQGTASLLWAQAEALTDGTRGRRFFANDLPTGKDVVYDNGRSVPVEVVANRRGDTITIWNRVLPGGIQQGFLRRESSFLRRLNRHWNHPVGDVAIDQAGNYVLAWTAPSPDGSRVLGQRYSSDGSRRGPEFNAATRLDGSQTLCGVAMNHRTGEFVIVWERSDLDRTHRELFGQRFGFTTGRQGSEFPITTTTFDPGHRLFVDVGRAEDGSFVVAWSFVLQFQEAMSHIRAQRFNNLGAKIGSELTVANPRVTDAYMRLAVAPQGHFAMVWDDDDPPLVLQLYHRDGAPTGPARGFVREPSPGAPDLAFGWNGTLMLGWTDWVGIHEPNDDTWEVNFQRFATAPGVEFCGFRDGHFRCDTDGGGTAEVDHAFAVAVGIPMLGDIDADGRDDYCLFRDNRFECDVDHDYGSAEFSVPFGQNGDTPLLGDLDGDRRDDACVFRAGRFLCDTGHDGGTAELDLAFGQVTTLALLGDLNGDGRDDACEAVANELRCDTAHDGGAAELVLLFPLGLGQTPMLADVNGDGRDEPCVGANGEFACDLARDGGQFDFFRSLANPGVPLIGNVDGI